jgi:hypothetical protein
MAMYLRLTIEEVDEERNVVGLRAAVVFGAHQRSRTPPTKAGGQGTGPSLIGVQATGQIITTWLGRMLEPRKSCCTSRRMSSQTWTASQLLSVVMAPSVSRHGVLTG